MVDICNYLHLFYRANCLEERFSITLRSSLPWLRVVLLRLGLVCPQYGALHGARLYDSLPRYGALVFARDHDDPSFRGMVDFCNYLHLLCAHANWTLDQRFSSTLCSSVPWLRVDRFQLGLVCN